MKQSKIIAILIAVGFLFSLMPLQATNAETHDEVRIQILTRHASTLYSTVYDAFQESSYATNLGFDYKIIFKAYDTPLWETAINAGGAEGVHLAWGGGPTTFDQLIEDGYAKAITDPEILSDVAYLRQNDWINDTIAGSPMFRNGTGADANKIFWVGSAIASFGFTINTGVLENRGIEAPSSWVEIGHPYYYYDDALVAIGSAQGSTSNTRIYEIIIQKFGWQLGWGIIAMIAGNSGIKPGSAEPLSAVEFGDVGIANTIDFYGFEAELLYENCKYILPENESIVNSDPIMFIENPDATADSTALANAYMKFILSDEGQATLLNNQITRMPIRSDAFNAAPTDDSDYSHVEQLEGIYNTTLNNTGIEFNDTLSLSYLNTMIYYWEAVNNDASTKLREVMKEAKGAVINPDYNLTNTQLLKLAMALGNPVGDPKVTMDYAISINSQIKNSETFRISAMNSWKDASDKKYEEIKEQLKDASAETDFGISDAKIAGIENPFDIVDIKAPFYSRPKGVPAFDFIIAFFSLFAAIPLYSILTKKK